MTLVVHELSEKEKNSVRKLPFSKDLLSRKKDPLFPESFKHPEDQVPESPVASAENGVLGAWLSSWHVDRRKIEPTRQLVGSRTVRNILDIGVMGLTQILLKMLSPILAHF